MTFIDSIFLVDVKRTCMQDSSLSIVSDEGLIVLNYESDDLHLKLEWWTRHNVWYFEYLLVADLLCCAQVR